MAAGARALVEAAGNDPAVVISPVLTDQPIVDFQNDPSVLSKKHHNDSILTPNFTNILVAYLPTDCAAAAVKSLVDAIECERDAIAKCCWRKLTAAGLVEDTDIARREQFFGQVRRFPGASPFGC